VNPPAFDVSTILAGFVAYAVAIVLATLLVFLTFRLNARLTARLDGEELLRQGHRSSAVVLGAILLSQAVLMRHAVFPVMVVVRDLFLNPHDAVQVTIVICRCVLFVVVVAALSVGSVLISGWLFSKMTGSVEEHAEIARDNQAVAIFFAFALLAITMVLNEGMEDLSRSLIPYGQTGVVRLP
jgi:uncharacterized membrane protein YjfL (UPF0719 family)